MHKLSDVKALLRSRSTFHASRLTASSSSNALYGLALSGPEAPFGYASFSGRCTYQEYDWPEPIGNYEFVVYVEDRNEPGDGTDHFWIEVRGGMTMGSPAEGKAVEIQEGGDIFVPH